MRPGTRKACVCRRIGIRQLGLLVDRCSLIDKHDRDIILYPVKKLALVTDKAISGAVEAYVTLALRTA